MTNRTQLIELRCSACGEYLGTSAPHPVARYCSVSCEGQPLLRKNEARDSLVCEQWASDMSQVEIAEFHDISKQVVSTIIKAF